MVLLARHEVEDCGVVDTFIAAGAAQSHQVH